jgi:uncharacterized protein with gpF-like domain
MESYAKQVEKLVHAHVVEKLPILGSGDPLDRGALDAGLAELGRALDVLAERTRKAAALAGDRTLNHAVREVTRAMNVKIPVDPTVKSFQSHDFVNRQVQAIRKVGRDQVEEIRKAIVGYEEGTSMRDAITHKLWVSRNRSKLVARTEPMQFAEEQNRMWNRTAGSEAGVYCTRRDELVRHTHALLDGTVHPWTSPPRELGEPNCRCRMVAVEAFRK